MTTTAVLLDIEGTTTSISFVFDVLFPYAAKHLADFLASHGHEAAVQIACAAVRQDALPDEKALPPDQQVLAIVRRQMAGDVKASGLKQLQGLIWQHGYESGAIKGHVYDDVPVCFSTWRQQGRPIAIYSSGSVLAQKLLFRHSTAGDLSGSLVAHYDTSSGAKREASSYATIASTWGRAPDTITFCTDQPGEAEAAATAGLTAIVIMRPGNAPLPAGLRFPVHADLTRI